MKCIALDSEWYAPLEIEIFYDLINGVARLLWHPSRLMSNVTPILLVGINEFIVTKSMSMGMAHTRTVFTKKKQKKS